jgi:hypothetical protein
MFTLVALTTKSGGWVMTNAAEVSLQLFASVTTRLYVPGQRFVIVVEVAGGRIGNHL